jgi:hypothetical protein
MYELILLNIGATTQQFIFEMPMAAFNSETRMQSIVFLFVAGWF